MKEAAFIILPVIMVCTNLIIMLLSLPRKKPLSFILLACGAMIAVNAIADIFIAKHGFSETARNFLFLRTLPYLPLIIWLFNGFIFQKMFAFFMQITLTSMLNIVIGTLVIGFMQYGEQVYFLSLMIISFIVFFVYVILVWRFGRQLLERLFAYGHSKEWALYSLSAAITFFILEIISRLFFGNIYNLPAALIILLFVLWSFIILCFAIINTHEKTKKQYEAEFARDIISSGREHYQKMNEINETLRIMRHDYKYHLNTISELLNSGNKSDIESYLADIQNQLSEKVLYFYCSNTVINALLVSYSERCIKQNTKYSVNISMPQTITVPNYEMCIILGNLLENALNACQNIETNRFIELAIKTQGEHLAVMVKNSFNGIVTETEGSLISPKKGGGFGLRSVKAVSSRYNGELIIEWDSKTFTAYVMI
ncbi:MAG: GHKL domain-containing protein [Treponema sp.]|nr:GHKL domain-containing protein [Treponema sp.]